MATQLKDDAIAALRHEIKSCEEKIRELQARDSGHENTEETKWQQRKLEIIKCIIEDAQKGEKNATQSKPNTNK